MNGKRGKVDDESLSIFKKKRYFDQFYNTTEFTHTVPLMYDVHLRW